MNQINSCYATFTGRNGYELENKRANEVLTVGKIYRVIGGEMGQSYTYLELEGVNGSWDSAMFDIEGELPFSFYICLK